MSGSNEDNNDNNNNGKKIKGQLTLDVENPHVGNGFVWDDWGLGTTHQRLPKVVKGGFEGQYAHALIARYLCMLMGENT